MSLINNIILSGYFYTSPAKRYKRVRFYNFYGNILRLTGNAIFLPISRNISYHILEGNISHRVASYLTNLLCNKQAGEKVIFVSLSICNIQANLTLFNCDRKRLLTEVLPLYEENFLINSLKIVQEDQAPAINVKLGNLSSNNPYINLRLETGVGKSKKITVRFVQLKNKTATSVQLIITECTPVSLQIVEFFKNLAVSYAMYTLKKDDVEIGLQICLKSANKKCAQIKEKVRHARKESSYEAKCTETFASHVCNELFEQKSETASFQSIKEISNFFKPLTEIFKSTVQITSSEEGNDSVMRPSLDTKIGLAFTIDIIGSKSFGEYTARFQLEDVPIQVAAIEALNAMMVKAAAEIKQEEIFPPDTVFEMETGFEQPEPAATLSVGAEVTPRPVPYAPLCEDISDEEEPNVPPTEKPNRQDDSSTLLTQNNSDSASSYISSSEEEEDEEEEEEEEGEEEEQQQKTLKRKRESLPQPSPQSQKKKRLGTISRQISHRGVIEKTGDVMGTSEDENEYVERSIASAPQKPQQKKNQRRLAAGKDMLNTKGFVVNEPELTTDFLRQNTDYVSAIEDSAFNMYQTWYNIAQMGLRIQNSLKKVMVDGTVQCNGCLIHCAGTIGELKLKTAGRPPGGGCRRFIKPVTPRKPSNKQRRHKTCALATKLGEAASSNETQKKPKRPAPTATVVR